MRTLTSRHRTRRPVALAIGILALVAGLATARPAAAEDDYFTPDPALWCSKQNALPGAGDILVSQRYWGSPQLTTTGNTTTCNLVLLVEDEALGSHFIPWKLTVDWAAACNEQFPGSRYVFTPGSQFNASCALTAVRSYRNHIVSWDGDTKAQKTSWVVASNLTRYWIPDGGTFNCLKGAGIPGPDAIGSRLLDQLSDHGGQAITCGSDTLAPNRVLLRGSYLRSPDGRFKLWLQADGNLVLYGPQGVIWANYKTSDILILQGDGNLVTYAFGGGATWWSGTAGTGANRLALQNDGNLVLYSPSRAIWTYRGIIPPPPTPATYRNHLVSWDGDTKAQKTSWVVASNLTRYWIPDGGTFNCLKGTGFPGADLLSSQFLDQLPDHNGQHVACGTDTIGINRVLVRNSYLRSGDGRFKLWLQADGNLVLYGPQGVIWANYKTSDILILQGDGNLVTYAFGGGATWWSGTAGTGANRLALQNDGNLVLYSPSRAIWTYRGRI